MQTLDKVVRRIFAWPIIGVGFILTIISQMLIEAGAWILDINTESIPNDNSTV